MKTKTKKIRISDLQIDPQAQRKLRPGWAQDIADNLDMGAIGVIHVATNGNGKQYIVDGQHRVEALRITGNNDALVDAKIYENTNSAMRAKLFLDLNRSRTVRAYDKFITRVTSGDPVAVDIKRLIEAHNLTLTDTTSKSGTRHIRAVTSLEAVYTGRVLLRKDGPFPEVLDTTLRVIGKAWGHDDAAFDGLVIESVGALLHRFGTDIDPDRLAKKMKSVLAGPVTFVADSRQLKKVKRISVRNAACEILVGTYNHQLRSSGLPSWER